MRFRNLHEIPEEYRNLVELLIAKGVIAVNNGDFEYPLNLDQLYLIKIILYNIISLKNVQRANIMYSY